MDSRELLEVAAVTAIEENEELWGEVMTALDLPVSYALAAVEALRQSRWRQARNPAAYLRRAAMRIAVRRGFVDHPEIFSTEPASLSELPVVRDSEGQPLETMTALADHHRLMCAADDDEDGRPYARRVVADQFLIPEDKAGACDVNWEAVAQSAGLDASEVEILKLRLRGVTRSEALGTVAKTEGDRLRLQAAWRRLERHTPALRRALLRQE